MHTTDGFACDMPHSVCTRHHWRTMPPKFRSLPNHTLERCNRSSDGSACARKSSSCNHLVCVNRIGESSAKVSHTYDLCTKSIDGVYAFRIDNLSEFVRTACKCLLFSSICALSASVLLFHLLMRDLKDS